VTFAGDRKTRLTCVQRHFDVKNFTPHSAISSRATIGTLMLAVFTVSVGYGVVLPLLPNLIERLPGAVAGIAQVSRHTGLLTGVYTLALFLFAPIWGRTSDWLGRRNVLLVGLFGFGITMVVFSSVESLAAVYTERFLSGLFAAAVTPVAAAAIGDLNTTDQVRAHRLAFVSMAGIAGFLVGPMLSVLVSRLAVKFLTAPPPTGSFNISLVAIAFLAIFVAVAVAFAVPPGRGPERLKKVSVATAAKNTWIVPKLLILTFIVSAGIGVFEVGLALRGKQDLRLTSTQIALMFSECSLVMFVVQAIIFSPGLRPGVTRWFISPALAALAASLFFVPWASNFALMLAVVGVVAASAGVLSPMLTYWISSKAGSAQGWELGKQTSAASLGVTIGSAAGGLLFDIAVLPGASFILAALLAALGCLLSIGLPRLLVPEKLQDNSISSVTLRR
jgi:MFS family permease